MILIKQNKILTWFQENGHNPAKLIKNGLKRQLTEAQIREGMERVYDRHMAGENIAPGDVAWRTWDEAEKAQGADYIQWEKDRGTLIDQVDKLKQTQLWLIIYAVGASIWIAAGIWRFFNG